MSFRFARCAVGAALFTALGGLSTAWAADPIKVGVALDISGPFAAPGAEVRDGINLAVKLLDGKLGGYPAEFIQADMAGNPCLLYTSPSPRDVEESRMPSSA